MENILLTSIEAPPSTLSDSDTRGDVTLFLADRE